MKLSIRGFGIAVLAVSMDPLLSPPEMPESLSEISELCVACGFAVCVAGVLCVRCAQSNARSQAQGSPIPTIDCGKGGGSSSRSSSPSSTEGSSNPRGSIGSSTATPTRGITQGSGVSNGVVSEQAQEVVSQEVVSEQPQDHRGMFFENDGSLVTGPVSPRVEDGNKNNSGPQSPRKGGDNKDGSDDQGGCFQGLLYCCVDRKSTEEVPSPDDPVVAVHDATAQTPPNSPKGAASRLPTILETKPSATKPGALTREEIEEELKRIEEELGTLQDLCKKQELLGRKVKLTRSKLILEEKSLGGAQQKSNKQDIAPEQPSSGQSGGRENTWCGLWPTTDPEPREERQVGNGWWDFTDTAQRLCHQFLGVDSSRQPPAQKI